MKKLKIILMILTLGILIPPVGTLGNDKSKGLDITMPLVEKALQLIESKSISPPHPSQIMRAAVYKVCSNDLSGPGCKPPGSVIPAPDLKKPQATRAWRNILESALAAQMIKQGNDFDKTAFQRFVVDAMVDSIKDPSSFYIAPSIYRKIGAIDANFAGFGMMLRPEKEGFLISAIHKGSPASKTTLKPRDLITGINDQPVTGFRRAIALAALWGADGNKIKVQVKTPSGNTRTVNINYEHWTFKPYTLKKTNDIITVKINHFERGLAIKLALMADPDSKGLVLDLRYAGEGDADEMAQVANLLLERGNIGSMKTRGGLGDKKWDVNKDIGNKLLNLPVVIFVSKSTFLLGEILAMALRTYTRALLVGTATTGVSTRDILVPFPDGSAIQLTSTKFSGSRGKSLDKGVLPHLKTDRPDPLKLAHRILKKTKGHSLDQLIDSAKACLK